MVMICQKCASKRIDTLHMDSVSTDSTFGAIAGAASVAACVFKGAELGTAAGTVTGP